MSDGAAVLKATEGGISGCLYREAQGERAFG